MIYYSGDELPRTQDLGGAEAGTSGTAGGDEAHHRTQTIKIARGGSLVSAGGGRAQPQTSSSRDAVANLLAIRPESWTSACRRAALQSCRSQSCNCVVAPAPNVVRDYTRNGVQLDSVIAPAPSLTRDRTTTAPNFSANLIPPAPSVSSSHTSRRSSSWPSCNSACSQRSPRSRAERAHVETSVVAPAPTADREQSRSNPALAGSVIPPAPGGVSRELSSSPVQMTNAAVVPPPVSAPERNTGRNSKLDLPASSVVAPPPSADVSQDTHRLAGGNTPDPSRAVVPPPPTQSASGSFMSSLMGKLFGASEVVPRLLRFIRTARLAGAELPLQRTSFHRHLASRQVRPAVVRAARETGWVALLDRTWLLHRLPQVYPAAPALVLGRILCANRRRS